MVKLEQKPPAWTLRAVALGLALLLFLFLLPLLLLPGKESDKTPGESALPTATLPLLDPVPVSPVEGWDEGQSLRLLKSDGTIEQMTLSDYLWGVVAAEMPASFQPEALKAQAVAARTYCLYLRGGEGEKHPGADVCTDHTCCQAYLTYEQAAAGWGQDAQRYADKITQAIADTNGLLCLYEGQPIDAVFFSSTAGKTSGAMEVWGTEVPYLVSVDSPEGEEVPGWRTVVTFTPSEFTERFRLAFPEADFSAAPESWFQDMETDDSGTVTAVTIGGVRVTGGQARAVFGLRSAHFAASATGEEVTFWVTGYGHSVGMSQYGANALAAQGNSFQQILEWYYTGAKVSPWDP